MLRPVAAPVPLADVCAVLGLPPAPGAVSGLTLDSRAVQPGDCFAALPGAKAHGAAFVDQVLAAGATAVLTDPAGAAIIGVAPVPVLVVDDPRSVLGAVAAVVYQGPLPRLIGVTGTNGKTTTTHCIEAVLQAGGLATGVIGTLGVHFRQLTSYSGRTTPEAPEVHATLHALAEAGADCVAMEVSSHALALHRVDGLHFEVGVFLNLTQDHLDFHHSMAEYYAAKARLFEPGRTAFAVINVDDAWGRQLAAECPVPFVTYGLQPGADWTAETITPAAAGITGFTVSSPMGRFPVRSSMPGDFNVANALAALATAAHLGVDPRVGAAGLQQVAVPGRLEHIGNDRGIAAYADYAHTPDAVERVLTVVRAVTPGRVFAVMGCGGDRDPEKRPVMGRIAATLADALYVTDDNPRSESPAAIRAQVLSGIDDKRHVTEIGDRAAAIQAAVEAAQPGDCVIVLGKGHESGQEIAGVVHPFDDRAQLRLALGVNR